MIQPNELRIGNFVEKGGEIFVADFLTIKCAINYNSIPLSFELLEKIESDNNKTGYGTIIRDNKKCKWDFNCQVIYFDNKGVFNYQTEDDNFFGDFVDGIKLNSLHQLQNIYFALTNKELIYNP